ncbi:MAG: hypothetical protein AAF438_21845, partial [Pseudomonadota bacterium]
MKLRKTLLGSGAAKYVAIEVLFLIFIWIFFSALGLLVDTKFYISGNEIKTHLQFGGSLIITVFFYAITTGLVQL